MPDDDLRSLFEAERWAASSYVEQPWSDIVATRALSDVFERLPSCRVEGEEAGPRRCLCSRSAACASASPLAFESDSGGGGGY